MTHWRKIYEYRERRCNDLMEKVTFPFSCDGLSLDNLQGEDWNEQNDWVQFVGTVRGSSE